jgi:sugar lactone lactonase YvrE
VSGGQIFLIDPKHPQAEPPIIAQFPNGSCITGITEVNDDVFYTAGALGDVYKFSFEPNTSSVWGVDMRTYTRTGKSSVRKVVDIPLVQVPNGITLLPKEEGIILIADSAGAIWEVDVYKGTYKIFFDDPLLKSIPGSEPAFGVNEVRIVDGPTSKSNLTHYFTNTNHGCLGTVPISLGTGKPMGLAVLLSENVPDADDFAVDSCGNVWLWQRLAV